MRILVFIPQSRQLAPHLESVERLEAGPHDLVVHRSPNNGHPGNRWEIVTAKYQAARQMFLLGTFDALWCIEDDIMVPPDALARLVALDADVAYGLVTTRRDPHLWSADIQSGPGDDDYRTYDMEPGKMREAWRQGVIDVIGCGLFCTLIRRHVLEQIDFTMRGSRCADFYFAYDVAQAGFTQKCDTRLLCGHIMNSEPETARPPWQVVYPDGETRYRIVEVTA